MQIDQTGFNVEYWSRQTQKDFLAEYEKDIHRPVGVSKTEWKTRLIDYYSALKHNSATTKVVSSEE